MLPSEPGFVVHKLAAPERLLTLASGHLGLNFPAVRFFGDAAKNMVGLFLENGNYRRLGILLVLDMCLLNAI